jgi:hypothetical protein
MFLNTPKKVVLFKKTTGKVYSVNTIDNMEEIKQITILFKYIAINFVFY